MVRTIEAVYENGIFRPLKPVKLEDGQRVTVYIPWLPSDVTPEQREQLDREIREGFADWTEQDWAEFESTFKRGG